MRFYIIISIFLSLEYASLIHQNFDGKSDCLTDELYGDFTVEEYNNLVKRRKLVRARMQNKLSRNEPDTLFIPVVFHNYYEIIDGTSSRSFCDYESGNNENGVYTNNSDSLCFERAKNALEILNQQFEIMHETIQIKFIPPEDTSLVVDDIKGNGTLFIYNNNWQDIRNNYNIDNVLNIYIDYCIGRENTETGNLECGSVGGWTLYPEYISTISPHGLAITHSAFPGINDNSTGILAHELGHIFTLRHLYHLPVIKNDSGIYEVVSDFQRELVNLVNADECNSRGDMICDTPGQPLQDIGDVFDSESCIYHGFGGDYNSITKKLRIGGSDKTGTPRTDFDDYANLIAHSNFDDIGDFWGTQGIPDSCFLSNQEEYSTDKCVDTLYKSLPIASNFLQWKSVMDNCLNEQDIGFTREQLLNIITSLELDYTACSLSIQEGVCNPGLSARSNIPPSDLFLTGVSSCRFPCATDGGCLVTDINYQIDYSQYDCFGNILSITNNLTPQNFEITQVYPNPFNPITSIHYSLNHNANIQLLIYDIQGRVITTLIDGFQTAGYHSVIWDASKFSSGIYFLNMSSGKITETKKMVLMK